MILFSTNLCWLPRLLLEFQVMTLINPADPNSGIWKNRAIKQGSYEKIYYNNYSICLSILHFQINEQFSVT